MLPALGRLPGVRELVEDGAYFVVHAPRQSGKTTAIKALVREINSAGTMAAIYCTLESMQGAKDPDQASGKIRDLLWSAAEDAQVLPPDALEVRASAPPCGRTDVLPVRKAIRDLCQKAGKPLSIFFDEADCLTEDVLIAFLRQLRDGYVNREDVAFAHSVALVGMLDIRDYKAQIRPDGESMGQVSPFNIVTEDLLVRNFTEAEVGELYAQHTAATGQVFADGVVAEVWRWTQGQPWLVNALARECVEKIHGNRHAEAVTVADVVTAKETIIRRRDTHVDSLMERLREPRVRRVVEPVILGGFSQVAVDDADWRFVVDLGLMREKPGGLVPGNPIYAEILLRYLSRSEQVKFSQIYPKPFWLAPDGGLDMPALMAEFQRFWRENSGADREVYGYKEATPHLVMMAFLQRVVNGGGRILREMALGSGRLDLCVEYGTHRYAVELKLRRHYAPEKSHAQLAAYLDTLGLPDGWMAIFDEDKEKPWTEKLWQRDVEKGGKVLHLVGL